MSAALNACVAALVCISLPARASTVVYDQILIGSTASSGEYTDGADLDLANPTISGCSGAWGAASGDTETHSADGLSHSKVNAAGGAIRHDRGSGGYGEGWRDLTDSLGKGSSAATVWFASLHMISHTDGTTHGMYWYYNKLNSLPEDTVQWGIRDKNLNAFGTSQGAATAAQTYLFICKLEKNYSGTTDRWSVWIDPADVSDEASMGAADASGTSDFWADDSSLYEIRFDAQTDGGVTGDYAVIDEIQVATTFGGLTFKSVDNYATWSDSSTLYLDATANGANVADTVLDFPVLIRLDPDNFTGFANTEPAGADIRFAKTDGTHLPYEIERWVDVVDDADTAEIWVLVDSVLGGDTTTITMYYNKTGATDSSCASCVFDTANGFRSVWHLSEDLIDATHTGDDLSNTGTTDGTGIVGKGRDFDGSSYASTSGNYTPHTEGTAMYWLKKSGTEIRILGSDDAFEMTISGPGEIGPQFYDASTPVFWSTDALTDDTWYFVAATWNTSTTSVALYLDGSEDKSSSSLPGDTPGTAVFRLGGRTTSYLNGSLDEVRMSDEVRSASWIALCYQNQKPSQTLVSIYATDTQAPTVSSLSPADDATGVSTSAGLEITFSEAVDAETGYITIFNSDDTQFEQISVGGGQVSGSGTATITINPSVNFAASASYYVQIDATAFDDAAGNSYAGISDKTTWNFTASASADDDYDNDWSHSSIIELNTTVSGADISDTLTDFPLAVRLNPGVFSDFGNVEDDGKDIRFAKTDGTHLPYEIERWNHVSASVDTAEIWVLLDSVHGNSIDSIIMYYGNASAVDSSCASCVFDTANGFVGVYHLDDDPNSDASGAIKDATILANNGTTGGTMTSSNQTAGAVGVGLDFENTDHNYVTLANESNFDITDAITVSAWITLETWPGDYAAVVAKEDNSYRLAGSSTEEKVFLRCDGLSTNSSSEQTQTLTSNLIHVAGRFSGSSLGFFENGESKGEKSAGGTISTNNDAVTIGRNAAEISRDWDGIIDEVRISKVSRGDDWIKLCYETQRPDQFCVAISENLDDWAYSMDLIINTSATGADVANDVHDFPLLVRLHADNFAFGEAESDGADIRFAKAGGEQLPYEIERWDASSDSAEIWVKVDTVFGDSASQYIVMYWGKSGAVAKSNSERVFDDQFGYKLVWHLDSTLAGDAGTAGVYRDLSGNNNHGADYVTSSTQTGAIGKGQDFDGSDNIQVPDDPSIGDSVQSALSYSMWIRSDANLTADGNSYRALEKGDCYFFAQGAGSASATGDGGMNALVKRSGSATSADVLQTLSAGAWYLLSAVFDGTDLVMYLNGTPTDTSSVGGDIDDDGNPLYVGSDDSPTYFDGAIDELRISNVARSPDWVKLCYETQKASPEAVVYDRSDLLPLTVGHTIGNGTSDTCLISTDRWSLIFDEDDGAGIKWLSDTAEANGTNQIASGENLFYLIFGTGTDTSSKVSGELTLVDSNSLYVKLRQTVTLSNQEFVSDYMVYGSGRMYIRVSAHNTGTALTNHTLRFRAGKTESGTAEVIPKTGTAATCPYILIADNGASALDIMFAQYDTLGDVTGFDTSTTQSFVYAGWQATGYDLLAGEKDVWLFMVDFSHRTWNDTSALTHARADDYRSPDSLDFANGTLRMVQSWEHELNGHWMFDEESGDTARDNSGGGYDGARTGGSWVDGVWGNGLSLSAAERVVMKDGGDFNNRFDCSSELTVMAWVDPDDNSGTDTIASHHTGDKGWQLLLEAGKPALRVNGLTLTASQALDASGGWQHVAATFYHHTRTIKLFVNGGVDTIRAAQWYMIDHVNDSLVVGAGYAGDIDDLRIYAHTVSEPTILAIAENGFRPDEGAYMVRADNNNLVKFDLDGDTYKRYTPVVQVANYWSSDAPSSSTPAVYLDGVRLTYNQDYVAGLDDQFNILWVGLNKVINASGASIAISATATPAGETNAASHLYWGVDNSTGDNHVWVRNFDGATFGESGSNQFFIDWKMANANGTDANGEISFLSFSETSPGNAADTSNQSNNLCPVSSSLSTAFLAPNVNVSSTDHLLSTASTISATPSFTVLESTTTRMVLRIDSRTASVTDGTTETMTLRSFWTIYPTGQLFRYDSVTALSGDIDDPYNSFAMSKNSGTGTVFLDKQKRRAGIHGASASHDMAIAYLSFANSGGSVACPWVDDTLGDASDASDFRIDFFDAGAVNSNWTSAQTPIETAFYIDLRRNDMSRAYIDSVCNGVQYPGAVSFSGGKGSLVTDSDGDIDGDGFNEREGAYIVQADVDNAIDCQLPASGDTCRFSPAFRVTGYTAADKPRYVSLYTASDTARLSEGYSYLCSHDRGDQELVIQLDTVICDTMRLYISADIDLAVAMGMFEGRPGDGNDTLLWRTESEHENLGFYLYRRVDPGFLDSLSAALDSNAGQTTPHGAAALFKQKKVSFADTAWRLITDEMIPGAEGGTSHGPRDYQVIDWGVHNDILYQYRLEAVDFDHKKRSHGPIRLMPRVLLPHAFGLWAAYPNPFRRRTTIRFALPVTVKVSLAVYNLQGRRVAELVRPDRAMKPGWYTVNWNASDAYGRRLAAAPYVYRLVAMEKGAKKPRYAKARLLIHVK